MAKFGPNQVCVSECNMHFPKKTYGRKILLVTQFKLASFLLRAVQVVLFFAKSSSSCPLFVLAQVYALLGLNHHSLQMKYEFLLTQIQSSKNYSN